MKLEVMPFFFFTVKFENIFRRWIISVFSERLTFFFN